MYDTSNVGSFNLNEGKLVQDNGVFSIMENFTSYGYLINEEPADVLIEKNRDDLKLYTRPTIPWSLECELVDGYDRQYGLEQFSLTLSESSQGTS